MDSRELAGHYTNIYGMPRGKKKELTDKKQPQKEANAVTETMPTEESYSQIYELYKQEGLDQEEIDQLLVLDIKDSAYFENLKLLPQLFSGSLYSH